MTRVGDEPGGTVGARENLALRLVQAGLDLSTAGYVITGPAGEVLFWNRAFPAVTGVEPRRGTRWDELRQLVAGAADDGAAERIAAAGSAAVQRPTGEGELFRLRTGRVVEVHSWPLPLFGGPVGRAWRFQDVTKLVEAREELAAANRLLEGIVQGAPYGILAVSMDGRLLLASDRFFELTGLDRSWANLPPAERAAQLESLAKDEAKARSFNLRWRTEPGQSYADLLERKDGAWFRVSTQPLRAKDGGVVGQLFFYEEVTAQVAAERELAASEARLRGMLEGMETGLVAVNRQGVITLANPAAARLLGLPVDEIVGRQVDWSWGAVREDGSPFPPPEMPVSLAITTGAAVRGVVMGVPQADGRLRWLLVSAGPLRRGPAGEVQEVAATFTDYTEHREREGLVTKARFLESFAALSAGVAHRLNNDLTAIAGNAWLLRQAGPLGEDQATAVRAIEEVAEDAAKLVADLRAAALGGDEPKTLVELDVCLGRALFQFSEADRRRAAVVLGAGVPRVVGRPRAIEAALQHLLANAFEATTGPVEARVMRWTVRSALDMRGSQRWEPGVPPPGEYAAVVIEDGGEGIAPEHLGRLFEPFFSTRFPGRGLGLPAASGIVREHGGYIGIASSPGRGTTVFVAFPVPGAEG